MAITFHPAPGTILFCDFSTGFKEPEMIKRRPVVVVSKSTQGRGDLVTILPLSTAVPEPVRDFHYLVPKRSLPMIGDFQKSDSWVKGDMICTVGFHRLDMVALGRVEGKRTYYKQRLGREQMSEIYQCMLHGVGFGNLCKYINEV